MPIRLVTRLGTFFWALSKMYIKNFNLTLKSKVFKFCSNTYWQRFIFLQLTAFESFGFLDFRWSQSGPKPTLERRLWWECDPASVQCNYQVYSAGLKKLYQRHVKLHTNPEHHYYIFFPPKVWQKLRPVLAGHNCAGGLWFPSWHLWHFSSYVSIILRSCIFIVSHLKKLMEKKPSNSRKGFIRLSWFLPFMGLAKRTFF